jgi:hypothetical protein
VLSIEQLCGGKELTLKFERLEYRVRVQVAQSITDSPCSTKQGEIVLGSNDASATHWAVLQSFCNDVRFKVAKALTRNIILFTLCFIEQYVQIQATQSLKS